MRKQSREPELSKDALCRAAKNKVTDPGVAEATHRKKLHALRQGGVLQSFRDGPAAERGLDRRGVALYH